ncbi:putative squamosa promoter-binding-like protein 19 isoform X1 [Phragmites australis]|uniref:putative squamosa promoter-binding-like protein 19 isoform X1 n=1 Tax=Phragmites australis TaxID=29695 RepID=UPI002D7843D1|nr:putative squamosa promoter-binding-like protein 19 isoform X1 [Phragmites australis]
MEIGDPAGPGTVFRIRTGIGRSGRGLSDHSFASSLPAGLCLRRVPRPRSMLSAHIYPHLHCSLPTCPASLHCAAASSSSSDRRRLFLAGGMDWASVSGATSWGAVADPGPTMVSFARPSSSTSPVAEARLHDFTVDLVQRARPVGVPGAGRRARAAGGGSGVEACSVDGCRSDLSRCREYHRRHKVCEAHSKTPVVVVSGQEQRFCQQCSRFHMLSKFDEGKRSCRKRLDDHNRRRRKQHHDVTNLGGLFPYHQVNEFAIYPRTIPTAGQNSDAMHMVDPQPPFSISFSGTFKAPKQFPFSHDGGSMLSASRHGLLLDQDSSRTRSSTCNRLSGTLDPECALSLLSSSLHPPSPARIPTAVIAQDASLLARFAPASQAATTVFASGGGHHVLVPDAVFEDPSQALPFPWE